MFFALGGFLHFSLMFLFISLLSLWPYYSAVGHTGLLLGSFLFLPTFYLSLCCPFLGDISSILPSNFWLGTVIFTSSFVFSECSFYIGYYFVVDAVSSLPSSSGILTLRGVLMCFPPPLDNPCFL